MEIGGCVNLFTNSGGRRGCGPHARPICRRRTGSVNGERQVANGKCHFCSQLLIFFYPFNSRKKVRRGPLFSSMLVGGAGHIFSWSWGDGSRIKVIFFVCSKDKPLLIESKWSQKDPSDHYFPLLNVGLKWDQLPGLILGGRSVIQPPLQRHQNRIGGGKD